MKKHIVAILPSFLWASGVAFLVIGFISLFSDDAGIGFKVGSLVYGVIAFVSSYYEDFWRDLEK